jgi:hypothetical protein
MPSAERGRRIAQLVIGDLLLLGFFHEGHEIERHEARVVARSDTPPAHTRCRLTDPDVADIADLYDVPIYHDTGESPGGIWIPVAIPKPPEV